MIVKTVYDKYYNYSLVLLYYIICVSFVFGVFFSPHLGFYISLIILLTDLSKIPIIRNTVLLLSIMMLLFTAVSRQIGVSPSDDLINTYMPIYYYQHLYQDVFNSGLGIEIGYPSYMQLISQFTINNSPRYILFFSVSATLILYYIWLVFFLMPVIDRKYRGVILVVSLLALQVGVLSQFLRQELATPVLLMCMLNFSRNKKITSFGLLAVATLIHSSSLIIFVFYVLFLKLNNIKKTITLGVFLLFSIAIFYSPSLVMSLFDILHLGFIGSKLAYYENSRALALVEAVNAGKFYLVILIIYLVFRKYYVTGTGTEDNKLVSFCLWASLCNLTLILMPNASRLFMLVPGFMLPIILYPVIKNKEGVIKIMLMGVIMISVFFPQRIFGGGSMGFELWDAYNWYGDSPLYFYYSIFG